MKTLASVSTAVLVFLSSSSVFATTCIGDNNEKRVEVSVRANEADVKISDILGNGIGQYFLVKDEESSGLVYYYELGDCRNQIVGGTSVSLILNGNTASFSESWCDDDGGYGNYSATLICK